MKEKKLILVGKIEEIKEAQENLNFARLRALALVLAACKVWLPPGKSLRICVYGLPNARPTCEISAHSCYNNASYSEVLYSPLRKENFTKIGRMLEYLYNFIVEESEKKDFKNGDFEVFSVEGVLMFDGLLQGFAEKEKYCALLESDFLKALFHLKEEDAHQSRGRI